MTAKKHLRQLYWLEKEIKDKEEELIRLRERAGSCAAKELTGMPGGSSDPDKIGTIMAKVVDLERYINKRIIYLLDLKAEIEKQIDEMPNSLYRSLLYKRYVLRMDWLTIADELGYSVQRCYQVHGDALSQYAQMYLSNKD